MTGGPGEEFFFSFFSLGCDRFGVEHLHQFDQNHMGRRGGSGVEHLWRFRRIAWAMWEWQDQGWDSWCKNQ
jgi:hypothetical protein